MTLRKIKQLDHTYNPKKISLDLNSFIEKWNIDFPWDYWWRKKYKVPFASLKHKEMCLVDMLIEYNEDLYMERRREKIKEREEDKENQEMGLDVQKTKGLKISKKEADKLFNELDLSEFN